MDAPQHDPPEQLEPTPLRPSVALIVVSVVNMLMGAATVSMGMVGIEMLWPSVISYGMPIVIFIGLATMLGQYFVTFRGSAYGLGLATAGSLGCPVVLYVAWLVIRYYYVDWTQPGASVTSPEENWIVWPLIAFVSFPCAWLNGRWTWLQAQQFKKHLPRPVSISLREIMAFCLTMGLLMIPASYRASVNPSLYRANVSVTDVPIEVPEGAQAIQYERQRDGRILVSYEIDETSFREWLSDGNSIVQQQGGSWEEFTSPLDVHGPDPNQIPLPISFGNHRVDEGLSVFWQSDTLYHAITYDRATGTAYYQELKISD